MMKKMLLVIAVCCGVSGVNGVELIYDDETIPNEETRLPSTRHMSESNSSFGEVSKTPGNSSDDGIESTKSLSELACDAVANKERAHSLIRALSNDRLSADIIESVYWDFWNRARDYTERYNDFMEILHLLGTVHYIKHEGSDLTEELLLDAYKRGAFKYIEDVGPFDEFEPYEETRSPSTRHMSESNSGFGEVSKTPGNSSDDEISDSCSMTTGLRWIVKYKGLVELARTNGNAFDNLIELLTKDKMVPLYDYISRVCWNGMGMFGASHDGTTFYATYECQQYID